MSEERSLETSKFDFIEKLDSIHELQLDIATFLTYKDMAQARLVSGYWATLFSRGSCWTTKLSTDFNVTKAFREVLRDKQDNAAFICYQRLDALTTHLGLETHHRQFLRSALKGEVDQSLFVDCLLDDVSLLKRIPANEMTLWFAISSFAGCQSIPMAIIDVYPITLAERSYFFSIPKNHSLTLPWLTEDVSHLLAFLEDKNKVVMLSRLMMGKNITLIKVLEGLMIEIPNLINEAIDANLLEMTQKFFDQINNAKSVTEILNRAVKNNHPALIDYFLEVGMKPDQTTLESAAMSGKLERLKFFIETLEILPNMTTLILAAKSGNLEMVKFLIENYQLMPSQDVLNAAASSGNLSLIHYLLNPGFNLIIYPSTLWRAAASHNMPTLACLLDLYTIKLNLMDLQELLCSAAEAGDLTMLLCLKDRFNLTLDDDAFEYVFESAIKSQNPVLVKFLLDPDNHFNSTLINFDWFNQLEHADMVRYLFHPDTPLYPTATKRKIVTPVQQLLRDAFDTFETKGSTLHLRDKTCLPFAVRDDAEYFYNTMDAILREATQSAEILELEILQSSPLPSTQFLIAEHAMSHRTLDVEVIKKLLEKAKRGFDLLGKTEWLAKADALLADLNATPPSKTL